MGLKRWLIGVSLFALCGAGCKEGRPPPPPPSVPADTPKPPEPVAPPRAEVPVEDPDESPLAWTIYSADGKSTLKQKPAGPGKCYAVCTGPDGNEVWSATAECLGQKSDRKFFANDCVRTVVMMPAPDRAKQWRQAEVMRVYKREKLDYRVMGVAAMPDEKLIKGSKSWLKGCYGVPGEPPRYSADGAAVEYERIDGKSGRVPLVRE
ncbi:MAG: hypothetical protein JNK82_02965 [Myxococcaceae bacterium]|nr:hypothetical protein [Myxococcaceae bacterium]